MEAKVKVWRGESLVDNIRFLDKPDRILIDIDMVRAYKGMDRNVNLFLHSSSEVGIESIGIEVAEKTANGIWNAIMLIPTTLQERKLFNNCTPLIDYHKCSLRLYLIPCITSTDWENVKFKTLYELDAI